MSNCFLETVVVTANEYRTTRFGNPYVFISFDYNETQRGTAYCFTPELLERVQIGDVIHIACSCRKEKFNEIHSVEIVQTNDERQI